MYKDFRQFKHEVTLSEGVYDPGIFKAFFMAGGPGSGKSYVAKKVTPGLGLKNVNSDNAFEIGLKKAGLSAKMPDSEAERRDPIRAVAKRVTGNAMDLYMKGRLGLVIDATARDLDVIRRQTANLIELGYDCYLIFVDTTLEVALQRNQERSRTVPEDIVRKSHATIQGNKPKLKQLFKQNYISINNDNATDDELNMAYKQVAKLVRKPVKNRTAKQWIENEIRKKKKR